jgi:hypothetical protein
MKDMITVLEATYRTIQRPPQPKGINEIRRVKDPVVISEREAGFAIQDQLDRYYADPANQHKKIEVVLMSEDVAEHVRVYLERSEGGHWA